MAKEIKHSICFRCKPRCRLELEVEDNQIVNVSTSPIKKCPRKWAPDLDRFYHPDRLNYPLKRVGEKGENKWQQITWDEAMKSELSLVPKNLTWESQPPVMPNDDGLYAIPVPGKTKVL